MFEGWRGRVVAPIMARQNRAAEAEAIDVLAPAAGAAVLAIGTGPGVGLALLTERAPDLRLAGVDPSAVMVAAARRRLRRSPSGAAADVVQARADALPWPSGTFDGVLSVNTVQLWSPLDVSLMEVARVMKPNAQLVCVTHDWAIERGSGCDLTTWLAAFQDTASARGFSQWRCWRARADGGRAVAFALRRT